MYVLTSPLAYLPVDLQRWDRDPGGDALVVSMWSDVRPLRGATGLLDWRLCGRLSQMVREGRVTGSACEKLLLVTGRLPWKRILAVGVGDSGGFGPESFRAAVDCSLAALRGIGARSIAIALPGRDIDRIRPELAVHDFLAAVEHDQKTCGPWVEHLTIVDPVPPTKAGGNLVRPKPPLVDDRGGSSG